MAEQSRLDASWLFHSGEAADADFMGYDDRAWKRVNLPHDWAVEQPFDRCWASGTGYLPGGTGWYRKHFVLPEGVEGKRVRVIFQGIYKHARVWINSNYLGEHAYGYTSFTMDISEFAHAGENVLAVRVEHEDVADSRWYTGSGIDRHVMLEISDMTCFATDGIFVSTAEADAEKAVLDISWETLGGQTVRFQLEDQAGHVIAGTEATCDQKCTKLTTGKVSLWSPDVPVLYTLVGQVCQDGEVRDEKRIPVGIRTFRFDPDHGFFLNGVSMKLKGVCVHHDAGCLGAAVPKNVWARRLKAFKRCGVNAIRTAHNPPDPDLLDLCDELGFLVMDEAFDEWEGIKNKWWQGHNVYPPKHFGYGSDFPTWHRIDLESMVRRDRNHPSIILWSIGNEIDYPNDPYVTPLFREMLGNNDAGKPAAERMYDARKPDASRLARVARELVDIVHNLDTTRPVTSAMSFPELSNHTGYADVLDLSGYNYREYFYEDDHRTYPGRVLLGSENSHDPDAWLAVRDHEFISGQFLWTGVDFLGECRGWPVRISQAGMLNLAGYEKPMAAQRRALWTDAPCLSVAVCRPEGKGERAWEDEFVWQGEAGEKRFVSVYTNQDSAELFVNGRSQGVKQVDRDSCRAVWEVTYEDGEIMAVSGELKDCLKTPGKAAQLHMQPVELAGEVRQLEICLTDADGNPARDEEVHVQIVGSAELMGLENGQPDDLTPYSAAYRNTYHGKGIAYVRMGSVPGKARVCAWTESGLEAEVLLETEGQA